jgi:uncharacterized phage protein (TIGR02218 family)
VRTMSAALAAHFAGWTHSHCTLVRVDLEDGSAFGLTDHNLVIPYDLEDGEIDYRPDGMVLSDISMSADLDPDSFEIRVPISDQSITRRMVMGRRFNGALVRVFEINHGRKVDGHAPIIGGQVMDVTADGDTAVLECMSAFIRLNQVLGRQAIPYCDADFADERCGATDEFIAATVIAVTSDMVFTVSFAGSWADGYFDFGHCEWLTGPLANTRADDIFTWTAAGQVTLFSPSNENPTIGDTLRVHRGCPKTRAECIVRQGNAKRMRACPEMPGNEKIMQAPLPGEGQ